MRNLKVQMEVKQEKKPRSKSRKKDQKASTEGPVKEIVEQVISWISTGKHRSKGINLLEKLSNENLERIWDNHFLRIIFVIISMLSDQDRELSDSMDKLLKLIIKNQASYFSPITKDITHFFIQSFRDVVDIKICQSYEETIQELIQVLDPQIVLSIILKYLNTEKKNLIYISILLLKKLSVKLNNNDLQPKLESILTSFADILTSGDKTMKRQIIFCIGTFYPVIGENIEEIYLKDKFSQVDISLIQRYCNSNN